MTYTCKNYGYGNYTRMVRYYIKNLYDNSIDYYNKVYGDVHPTGTKDLDLEKIKEFIGNTEDYLYYIYRVYNNNFLDVFTALNQKLENISVLPVEYRGLFGCNVAKQNLVLVSPVISGSRNLSEKERTRLYVGHELGHIVNSYWLDYAVDRLNIDEESYVSKGISLLDESITQNVAEDFAYCFAAKERPRMTLKRNLPKNGHYIFNGDYYSSNYDFYGELQEIAIMFGRTLRGIGKIDDDGDVLEELSRRSFSHDFFKDIFTEYIHDGKVDELIELLEKMGIIKEASYALFGNGDEECIINSKAAKNRINVLTSSLRDVREPLYF